jgi:hypothetical protein
MLKQLLITLGLVGSPADHPPVPCHGNCEVSEDGRALIKNFEGYSPFRYRDSAGYWTIGVGHLIKSGERIPEPLLGEAAERLLQQDIKTQGCGGACTRLGAAVSGAVRRRGELDL